MKHNICVICLSLLLLAAFSATLRATERPNVIWARTTSEAIALDGQLNESSWTKAQSINLKFGETDQYIPGSGYRVEAGVAPSDPMEAELKFLVKDNKLYMAAVVEDSSVGGGLFNKFDGFLMNLRDHSVATRPAPPFEYFYGWVTEDWANPETGNVGAEPDFFGWAADDRDVWDGKTVVHGVSNSDTTIDEGYTTELMFDLGARGYDVTDEDGDIIEFNISIYDADWQWPLNEDKFSGTRAWWCGPWGNASVHDVARIYARPDVTTESGSVPMAGPEMIIPNGVHHAAPMIDGKLDETVWANVEGFDIRFGDDELRAGYPGIGPYRSGQYQPPIDENTAAVLDPGDATVKVFFKGDMLYLGVDARDQAVWGINNPDMWDGIRFVINDRAETDEIEHVLLRKSLTAVIDTLGNLMPTEDLPALIDTSAAWVAMSYKPNTTVNNYDDVDEGYQIEMAVDLKELGYPVGRGDGVLFFSATLFDGEKFANPADNYGTRTWFYREHAFAAAPVWAYMDPYTTVTPPTAIEDDVANNLPKKFELMGNYPNPFNPSTTIKYALPADGEVTLYVYNVIGQRVASMPMGMQKAGYRKIRFDGMQMSSGLYFYQLEYKKDVHRQITKTGRMLLIK